MVKVECDGCKAPYQVDERRIPATGLKMRCPKCGTTFLVTKADASSDADLPAAPAPKPGQPGPLPRAAAAAPKPPPLNKPAAPPNKPAPPPLNKPAAPPNKPAAPPVKAAPPPLNKAAPLNKPGAPPRPPAKATLAFGTGADVDSGTDADLPAALTTSRSLAAEAIDLPARAAPHQAHVLQAHAQKEKGFGEIDLSVDLPSPLRTAPPSAGMSLEIDDLPTVHADGPPHADAGGGFGEIDLPIVHGDGDSGFGDPAPRGSFGELDLPSVADGDGLPMAFGSLPSVAVAHRSGPSHAGGFGELDLPMASEASLPELSSAGLPSTAGVSLPSVVAAGLPASATLTGMPELAGVGLPKPAQLLPTIARVDPPVLKVGGIGTIVGGADLYDDGLSHPAEALEGPRGLAPPTPGTHPEPDESSYEFGDEIALDEAPLPPRHTAPPAAAPAPSPPARPAAPQAPARPPEAAHGMRSAAGGVDIGTIDPGPGGDVGDEVELDAHADALDGTSQAPRSLRTKSPMPAAFQMEKVEIAPKRSGARRIVLIGVVVAVLGGSALALVPSVGAFGCYAISDQIKAPARRRALDELRTRVQAGLDTDTAAAATAALGEARAAHDEAARFRPTCGYAAYVAYARGLRFGRRAEDDAYAKQLLMNLGVADDSTLLANAAQDAATAQLARARQTVATLAERSPTDVDVASLAGEIELVAKDAAKATEAWKRAVGVRKSARTLFGLARAELAAGDSAGAEASAKETMTLSPMHVGARILIASVAWPTASREQEALTLLGAVTNDPAVRAMASDSELVEAYTVLGRIHLARSRMTAAEQAFKAAINLNPQALQALIGSGELFYRAGRFSEAQARFEAAMQADSDSVIAKVGKAKTTLAQEGMKEAKDLLKKLRTDKPKDALVAYWLGRTEEALGNKKEAEADYEGAIKLGEKNPEVVDAYVALARLLAAAGRPEDAAGKLADAVTNFPDSAALDKARGEVALQTGRFDDAKANFEHALAKQDDLGTKFDLGVAERRLRNFDAAGKIFDGVAGVDKEFPGLALERGLLFEQMGQSERALEMYNDALRKAPNDLDLKLRVASTQVIAGHAKQALPLLKEIQKARPTSAEANHFVGRAELVSGSNLADAMRSLETATELDPNHAEYWLYVGWAANEIGQPGKAESALKHALDIDRELGDAYWQRGVLLQKQGQTIDALADLKTALQKSPSRYEAYATIALCDQDLSNWSDAENAWRRAIAGDDGVAEWHYRLGKILYDHGNHPGAAPELDKAITLSDAADGKPQWLFEAHHLLGDCLMGSDRAKAKLHYQRFLELAPSDNAYRSEVESKLDSLGVHPQR